MKFGMFLAKSLALAIVLATVTPVLAQKKKVLHRETGPARLVTVKRLARVAPNLKMIGKWAFPIDPFGLQDGPPWYPIFDCFEAQTVAPWAPSEVYVPTNYNVTAGGAGVTDRWDFGPGYNNPYCANDMTISTGYLGGLANRVQLGFDFTLDGTTTGSEQLYIIIRTYDNFANTVAGFAANTSYSGPLNTTSNPANGEVFDMGVVPYLTTGGYYYMTQILAAGHEFKMPDDGATGSGAYVIIFAKTYNSGTGAYTPSLVSQPLLWVTKPNTGTPANPSSQNNNQWDDDNAVDGLHFTTPPNAVNEFYDYSTGTLFSATSPPFGAMLAFYSDVVPGFRPDDYSVVVGTEASTHAPALLAKDDANSVEVIGDGLAPNPTVEITGTSFYGTATGLSCTYKSSCSRLDMVERLRFYNYITPGFVGNAAWQRPPTASETTVTRTVTANWSQFINGPDHKMKVRIDEIPASDIAASDGWLQTINFVRWNVTP